MHILFLSDNFPPEVNAPASRTFEHCREWVRAGHRVTVITCAPNFPKGKIFAGYRNKLWQSEMIDGVHVIRVWSYITANEGFVRRILDYQSFMVTATLATIFVRGVDLVIGTSPQFFTVCAAYVVSRLKRIPFVFELRDIWPESIRAVGVMGDSRLLDALEKLELFLYRKASKIVSVTHSFKRNLVNRGVEPNKIVVVTNGVDSSRFKPLPKDQDLVAQLDFEDKFVVGYIGTHGLAHGLDTLLLAAQHLQNHPEGKGVRILMLGDGANKANLIAKAKVMELENVKFVESVSKDEVVRYWSLLDTSIIHLKKTELFTSVIPSKLFECMGMGIPVLHGVEGESAEIVENEKCGIAFEPENVNALCRVILKLKNQPELREQLKNNGLAAASRYDRGALAQNMLNEIVFTVKSC